VFLFSSLSNAIVAPQPGCGTGPACGMGFECTVVGSSGSCGSTPPCAPGASCPDPEPCTTTEEYGCTPAHCSADSDCAAGMVCHAWTQDCPVTNCACPPDAADCGCGVSACDPRTVSLCTPRYLLPCKVAADCGEGFSCQELVTRCGGTASGEANDPIPGGAAPAPSGGSAGLPAEPVPSCDPQPTGVFQCVANSISCSSAAQCPAGWTCEADAVPTASACAPGETCEQKVAPPPVVTQSCRPPYYGGPGVDGNGAETPTNASGEGSGTPTTPNSGTPSGTPAPEAAADDDSPSANESAACQMGHAPASSGAISLLALVGALVGLTRRRAQR